MLLCAVDTVVAPSSLTGVHLLLPLLVSLLLQCKPTNAHTSLESQ